MRTAVFCIWDEIGKNRVEDWIEVSPQRGVWEMWKTKKSIIRNDAEPSTKKKPRESSGSFITAATASLRISWPERKQGFWSRNAWGRHRLDPRHQPDANVRIRYQLSWSHFSRTICQHCGSHSRERLPYDVTECTTVWARCRRWLACWWPGSFPATRWRSQARPSCASALFGSQHPFPSERYDLHPVWSHGSSSRQPLLRAQSEL